MQCTSFYLLFIKIFICIYKEIILFILLFYIDEEIFMYNDLTLSADPD